MKANHLSPGSNTFGNALAPRFRNQNRDESPGVGSYDTTYGTISANLIRKKYPRQRKKENSSRKIKSQDVTPGPGAYEILPKKRPGIKYSIGNQKKEQLYQGQSETPGPQDYQNLDQIPFQFE